MTMVTVRLNIAKQVFQMHGVDRQGGATEAAAPASVTQFAYNSLGQLTQITDPLSHASTNYVYDVAIR